MTYLKSAVNRLISDKKELFFIVVASVLSVLIAYNTSMWQLLLFLAIGAAIFLYLLLHKRFLILFLIAGFVLFSRAFSHINFQIGPIPLYITEAVLIFTLSALFLDKLVKANSLKYLKDIPLKKEFLFFYFIGFVCLARGIIMSKPLMLTLRHSAMIYYSLFYFVMPILFNRLDRIERLFKVFFFALIFVMLIHPFHIAKIIDFYHVNINEYGGLGDYGYVYLSLAVIFEFIFFILTKRNTKKLLILGVILFQLFIILFDQVRSSWVALFMSFAFLSYLLTNRGKINKALITVFVSIFVISVISLGMLILASPEVSIKLYKEASSIIAYVPRKGGLDDYSARNSQWRIIIWKDIIEDIKKRPIFGWGFGEAFFAYTLEVVGWLQKLYVKEGWIPPHNFILDLTYKTGLIGLLAFLLIFIKFIARTVIFIKYICQDTKIKLYTTALLTCVIYIFTLSCFMVVLSGPYLGSFFWIAMGLIVALQNIYKRNYSTSKSAASSK